MTFTVMLDNPVQGGFSLAFNSADGTAQAGPDYVVTTSNPLSFDQSAGPRAIVVSVMSDLFPEGTETFTVTLGPIAFYDSGVQELPNSPVTISGSPATGTILNDDTVMPQLQIPEPQPPAPLPVVVAAADVPLVYRNQAQVMESPDWGRGGAEAGMVQEDVVVLKLVVPLGDGTFQEQEVARLPVDQLGKISELLRRLPDDRYRFYYLRRDGASWLILDVMLRDGKPVDPADVAPDPAAIPAPAPTAEPPKPATGGPAAAQPALEVVPAPLQAEPAPAVPAPAAGPDSAAAAGHPWRTQQALASGAALAACLPWADWQQRVHAALAQYPRRALQTTIRRRRRVPAGGVSRE